MAEKNEEANSKHCRRGNMLNDKYFSLKCDKSWTFQLMVITGEKFQEAK
jgi:hypothetical protein